MGVHQNICLIHVAIAHMSLLFREYISFYKTIGIGSRLEVLKGHSCDIEAKCIFSISYFLQMFCDQTEPQMMMQNLSLGVQLGPF